MGKVLVRSILLVFFAGICSSCLWADTIMVSPSGNDSNTGSSWANAKGTVQAGIAAVSSSGGEVWVAAGVYAEHITLKANSYLYGGFAGNETARNQRNFAANKSIVDGSVNISVTGTCIDGFTIRNSGSGCPAIDCYFSSNPTISNNTIFGNSDGIGCNGCSPVISNNTITANARGIVFSSPSASVITNNTICGNGYGVWCNGSNAPLTNNIIAFNTIGVYGNGATPTLKRNCVYGNTNNYSGLSAGSTDISVDPLLENWKYGKVHIQPGSPCRNAGDSSVVVAGSLDMDSQPRIQGASVDIGADESDGTIWPVNTPVFHVNPGGSDTNDGSSWATAKKSVQAGIDAASSAGGGEIWVATGVYTERIGVKTYCYLYGGFAGNETSRTQRDFAANKSILDGSGGGHVVSCPPVGLLACIDGFTVRNSGTNNYGILCSSSNLAISNNAITGNG